MPSYRCRMPVLAGSVAAAIRHRIKPKFPRKLDSRTAAAASRRPSHNPRTDPNRSTASYEYCERLRRRSRYCPANKIDDDLVKSQRHQPNPRRHTKLRPHVNINAAVLAFDVV